MQKTLKCYGCKQIFNRADLISYASYKSVTSHNYCAKCLKEKQEREAFADKVCQIFGIKGPGARIWTDRQRIQRTYGYSDEVIIKTLDYIYNVEGKKKTTESLGLVQPYMVEKMMAYEKSKEKKEYLLAQATKKDSTEYIVPIKENESVTEKIEYDPDEWLD